jgi:hypothetical protein
MQNIAGIAPVLVCIVAVIAAGCTVNINTPVSPAPAIPALTPEGPPPSITTQAAAITVSTKPTTYLTTENPAPVIPTTAVTTRPRIVVTTTVATDPILHRWILQTPDRNRTIGYEYRFYPGGFVTYGEGYTTTVDGNIILDPLKSVTGTWTKLGEMEYLVRLSDGSRPMEIVYTLVPAQEDSKNPGIIVREHIESYSERDRVNEDISKGILRPAGFMYYPERALID